MTVEKSDWGGVPNAGVRASNTVHGAAPDHRDARFRDADLRDFVAHRRSRLLVLARLVWNRHLRAHRGGVLMTDEETVARGCAVRTEWKKRGDGSCCRDRRTRGAKVTRRHARGVEMKTTEGGSGDLAAALTGVWVFAVSMCLLRHDAARRPERSAQKVRHPAVVVTEHYENFQLR